MNYPSEQKMKKTYSFQKNILYKINGDIKINDMSGMIIFLIVFAICFLVSLGGAGGSAYYYNTLEGEDREESSLKSIWGWALDETSPSPTPSRTPSTGTPSTGTPSTGTPSTPSISSVPSVGTPSAPSGSTTPSVGTPSIPPTVVPFVPYQYLGCYGDDPSRILKTNSGIRTISECNNDAQLAGSRYFGLQYAQGNTSIGDQGLKNKGECWHGSPEDPRIFMSKDNCIMGNDGYLGSDFSNALYLTGVGSGSTPPGSTPPGSTPTGSTPTGSTLTPANYLGCYGDDATRILPNFSGIRTISECAGDAGSAGSLYYGLQYANGNTSIGDKGLKNKAECWHGSPENPKIFGTRDNCIIGNDGYLGTDFSNALYRY